MYALDLLGTTDTTAIDTLYPPTISVQGWSLRINAPGKMVFTIKADNANATEEKLRMFRRVKLYRKPRDGGAYAGIWSGFILAKRQIGDEIQVICMGMLEFFTKRYTGTNETFNGQGSTEAQDLLTATNSTGATAVSTGSGGVTTTRNLTIDQRDIFRAWEELAQAHGAEFEIDADFQLNFVSALGSDKSSTVELQFRRDGTPGNDIGRIEIGEEGKPMANRVIGFSSAAGGLTSTQNDATSQSTYGIIVERKQFNDATNQTTLDEMTQAYLTQVANPIQDYRIEPTLASKKTDPVSGRVLSGLEYGDVEIGDLVSVVIKTASQDIETTKRIAELNVTVDSKFNERMQYTLTESGVFVTAAFLDQNEAEELRRKIRELEALV